MVRLAAPDERRCALDVRRRTTTVHGCCGACGLANSGGTSRLWLELPGRAGPVRGYRAALAATGPGRRATGCGRRAASARRRPQPVC